MPAKLSSNLEFYLVRQAYGCRTTYKQRLRLNFIFRKLEKNEEDQFAMSSV